MFFNAALVQNKIEYLKYDQSFINIDLRSALLLLILLLLLLLLLSLLYFVQRNKTTVYNSK